MLCDHAGIPNSTKLGRYQQLGTWLKLGHELDMTNHIPLVVGNWDSYGTSANYGVLRELGQISNHQVQVRTST